MAFQKSSYETAYTSLSGVDIRAYFGNAQIGTLQGISFNTTREVAPLYVMGRTNPRSFAKGKRAIAGSLIFTMFDQAALITELNSQLQASDRPYLNPDEAYEFGEWGQDLNNSGGAASTLNVGNPQAIATDAAAAGWKRQYPAQYPDQLPPFDVVLTGQNELGHIRTLAVLGCMILNNSSGVSIDDIMIEEAMTYVARDIHNWRDPTKGTTTS